MYVNQRYLQKIIIKQVAVICHFILGGTEYLLS